MSIRWVFVAIACILVTDCGSGDSNAESCEDGYAFRTVCIACGPAGGCAYTEAKCARVCSGQAECEGLHLFCSDSVCQVAGCI